MHRCMAVHLPCWKERRVNARLSQHLTLLGLCSMIFYGVMLGMGRLSIDVLPQFVISAIIFLSSGQILKKATVRTSEESDEKEKSRPSRPDPDWPWLTGFLNWMAALLIVGVMALILMKPPGMTIKEALSHTEADQHFYGTAVP
jgi:hypothetical protein